MAKSKARQRCQRAGCAHVWSNHGTEGCLFRDAPPKPCGCTAYMATKPPSVAGDAQQQPAVRAAPGVIGGPCREHVNVVDGRCTWCKQPALSSGSQPATAAPAQEIAQRIHDEHCRGYQCNGYRCELKDAVEDALALRPAAPAQGETHVNGQPMTVPEPVDVVVKRMNAIVEAALAADRERIAGELEALAPGCSGTAHPNCNYFACTFCNKCGAPVACVCAIVRQFAASLRSAASAPAASGEVSDGN